MGIDLRKVRSIDHCGRAVGDRSNATAIRTILGVALAAALGLACAQLAVLPSSRFEIDERFPDRLGEIEVLGIDVRSALSDGSVSEADLKRLSGFFSDGLRRGRDYRAGDYVGGRFGAVVNITADGNADKVDLILTVDISLLEAATQQERKKGVPSRLQGMISLRTRATNRSLGTATIWAIGSGLDLDKTYVPNTVRAFTDAIREIIN